MRYTSRLSTWQVQPESRSYLDMIRFGFNCKPLEAAVGAADAAPNFPAQFERGSASARGRKVVLNKDGSLQRTARFRGPDLDSATPAELVGTAGRLNNAPRRLGSGWAIFIEASRDEPRFRPAARQWQRAAAQQLRRRLVARRRHAGALFRILECQPRLIL